MLLEGVAGRDFRTFPNSNIRKDAPLNPWSLHYSVSMLISAAPRKYISSTRTAVWPCTMAPLLVSLNSSLRTVASHNFDSGEPKGESAVRAHAWIAEAALEWENSHYVPITTSWALSGRYLGCQCFVANLTTKLSSPKIFRSMLAEARACGTADSASSHV